MKLLVCVKQVPDSTVRVKVGADKKAIATEGVTWAISPYDEYAVEMALERKDADPLTTVSVVTVGSARARDALRQALAMGCDDATLVTGAEAETLGGIAVAQALAKIVEEAKPDLVLCGKQASDDDQGFVGPALAEALGWPHVAIVTKFAPAEGGTEIWKEVEGGHEVWRATGPAVLTIQKSEKEPRYPSLPGIMKAKKKEIPEKDLASLGVDAAGPRVEILEMEPPPARKAGRVMKDGDAKAMAAELAKLLRSEAKVV
ncbi:MAG TPA: electron transfer flavoprotein subunit beta/FixA family protein [Candidatus Limnocylindria bacterium]|nr:electron transfer flavoprotein subunit beta/FixA family protein [Candidatus Limnocylindria bacterium]